MAKRRGALHPSRKLYYASPDSIRRHGGYKKLNPMGRKIVRSKVRKMQNYAGRATAKGSGGGQWHRLWDEMAYEIWKLIGRPGG